MSELTRDELQMLLRHAELSARNTRSSLQHLTLRDRAARARREQILHRRLAVYEGAEAKLQAMLDALGPHQFPGLRGEAS